MGGYATIWVTLHFLLPKVFSHKAIKVRAGSRENVERHVAFHTLTSMTMVCFCLFVRVCVGGGGCRCVCGGGGGGGYSREHLNEKASRRVTILTHFQMKRIFDE